MILLPKGRYFFFDILHLCNRLCSRWFVAFRSVFEMAGGSKMSKRARLYESESEEMSEHDNLEVSSLFVLLLYWF